MKHSTKTYVALAFVGILAIISAWIVPTTELLKGIIATPAVVALIATLYQLLRDQAAFEKKKYFDMRKRVFEIGTWSGFVENTTNSPQYAETRSQKIDEIYKRFNDVLGLEPGDKVEETYAIESVKKKVRKILGIEELTKIRKYLIREAVGALEERT